jgi:hypothetical protein
MAPSSTTSEVRLATPFRLDLHIPKSRQGGVAGWFRDTERRERSNAAGSINTASEMTAQFLVIRLWRGCACHGKQGKSSCGFLGGLRKPADVEKNLLLKLAAALRSGTRCKASLPSWEPENESSRIGQAEVQPRPSMSRTSAVQTRLFPDRRCRPFGR